MTPIQKLETHLLALGDICIPEPGNPWILVDSDDNDLAEGMTLEEAAANLPGETENPDEIARLHSVIAAQRRLLIQWSEMFVSGYTNELIEQTKFIIE